MSNVTSMQTREQSFPSHPGLLYFPKEPQWKAGTHLVKIIISHQSFFAMHVFMSILQLKWRRYFLFTCATLKVLLLFLPTPFLIKNMFIGSADVKLNKYYIWNIYQIFRCWFALRLAQYSCLVSLFGDE